MQSGKILPIFRQFFAPQKSGSTGRDSNSRQSQEHGSEREATDEEAKRAAEMLQESEEFRRNGLLVSAARRDGLAVLLSERLRGNLLRVIRSGEVLRILLAASGPDGLRQGRILDRRV